MLPLFRGVVDRHLSRSHASDFNPGGQSIGRLDARCVQSETSVGPALVSTSHASLLEISDLKVEFPTRRGTLVAVNGVSFNIESGEVLGLVGESGAGKSMTGNAIIG